MASGPCSLVMAPLPARWTACSSPPDPMTRATACSEPLAWRPCPSRARGFCSRSASLLSRVRAGDLGLHASSVLSPDLEQRMRDLPERADPHRVHQHLEHVLILDHGLLKPLQHRPTLVFAPRVEVPQPLELRLLLVLGRADQLEFLRDRVAVRIPESVHADDRIRAVVLLVLVVHRLLLNLAALVAELHRAEHSA